MQTETQKMEATIKFTLPDEQVEFESAASGAKLAAILFDFDQYLRAQEKHQGRESISIEDLRRILRETMEDNGIYFEMLMFS